MLDDTRHARVAVKPRVSGSRRWASTIVRGALIALVASGCAKAKAEPLPESPPLVMPAPPPRVLAPVDQEPIASAPIVPETPPATPPPRTAARPPARPRSPAANDTPSPQESTPAVPAASVPTPAPEPPRELRSVDAAAEQKVRDSLGRAAKDLSRVDYQKLSNDGRSQYDQSKRLAEQAETALKERNTVFAATLADKAATLAAELLGR
jgi:hypothetical protein